MNRRWKDAFPPVDESFERSMDRAFKAMRKENRKMKKKAGVGFILAAALVLISATALAISVINYLPRQDARTRAHAALIEKYGLTEELLTMFNETTTGEGSDWEIQYDLPVYAEYAGTYRVVCSHGKVSATWSHDGEAFDTSGDLHDVVWGVPQLEHMRQLYKAHDEALARHDELGTYSSLSIEEKAAIDAPLLELPRSIDIIHIAPEDSDIQPEEAEALARDEILRRYAEDEEALTKCECQTSFIQNNEVRIYELLFRMDGQVRYEVRLNSPDGDVLSCQHFVGSDQDAGDLNEETVDDEGLSIEARAALHERMRKQGGDPDRK